MAVTALLCLALSHGLAGEDEPGSVAGVDRVAAAVPALRCTCGSGGEVVTRDFPLARDPYRVEAVPVGRRFSFKAVWTEGSPATAGVNLYAYHQKKTGPVLLAEVKYRPPYPVIPGRALHGFTGAHYVYEPDTGAEMTFHCAWVTP
jgi:hypothetical protein